MAFPVQAQILDYCVLALISKGDTYGYELNQSLIKNLDLSESTLYPVLRRLKRDKLLRTYDKAFDGRNRRYYSITPDGLEMLKEFDRDWSEFKYKVDEIVGGDRK
ncbi:MAG: PadR family transcriptional regulator [Tissierellia bacterium]|nr:PadR family transcriptional regulator [Tissierellia bacterium]